MRHTSAVAGPRLATESLRGLLLKRTATINLKPELEIFADDVKCAHGATVGEPDRGALFYLESRGIPPDEARKFIVLGFLEPVVARVPVVDAQDRLRELLEQKWDAGIGAGAVAAA